MGNVRLFDIRDPTAVVSYRAHTDSVRQVEFHPWFNTVITSGYDQALRVWCARDRVLMQQYNVGEEGKDEGRI